MPLVSSSVNNILKEKQHDYTKLTRIELLQVVAAASSQDAGNYGGQFVGFCGYMELVRQENLENQKQNEKMTQNSITIAKRSLYVAIVSTVIALISIVISLRY